METLRLFFSFALYITSRDLMRPLQMHLLNKALDRVVNIYVGSDQIGSDLWDTLGNTGRKASDYGTATITFHAKTHTGWQSGSDAAFYL